MPDSGIGSGTEDFESEFCIAFGVGCQSGGGGTKSDGGGGSAQQGNCLPLGVAGPPAASCNAKTCTVSLASGGVGQWFTSFADAAGMTAQFFSGRGGNDLLFGPDTVESQKMASSPGVTNAVNTYLSTAKQMGFTHLGLVG